MSYTVSYQLTVESEFHIGSGTGIPGLTDQLVLRDYEGVAYLPASHIKGLVRDSCYRLLDALGLTAQLCAGQRTWHTTNESPAALDYCTLSGRDECLLCALFGSPGCSGILWFSPVNYPGYYRSTLMDLNLIESDSAVQPHASIEPITRRARPKHLFLLEVVRPQETFHGKVRLLGQSASDLYSNDDLLTWLTAALLFTRRVGGKRRRGSGRCLIVLPDGEDNNDAALSQLDQWLTVKQEGGNNGDL